MFYFANEPKVFIFGLLVQIINKICLRTGHNIATYHSYFLYEMQILFFVTQWTVSQKHHNIVIVFVLFCFIFGVIQALLGDNVESVQISDG